MVFSKNAYGIKAKAHGQNPIGMMPNLLSLLMQTGRSPKTSACFSFPLSQLPSKISPVSKTSPACYFPSGFMWRRSRNSWPAGSCVMSENPLSERSELWISTNAFSRFPQALEFRPAATESPAESGRGASSKPIHILEYTTKKPGLCTTICTPGLFNFQSLLLNTPVPLCPSSPAAQT